MDAATDKSGRTVSGPRDSARLVIETSVTGSMLTVRASLVDGGACPIAAGEVAVQKQLDRAWLRESLFTVLQLPAQKAKAGSVDEMALSGMTGWNAVTAVKDILRLIRLGIRADRKVRGLSTEADLGPPPLVEESKGSNYDPAAPELTEAGLEGLARDYYKGGVTTSGPVGNATNIPGTGGEPVPVCKPCGDRGRIASPMDPGETVPCPACNGGEEVPGVTPDAQAKWDKEADIALARDLGASRGGDPDAVGITPEIATGGTPDAMTSLEESSEVQRLRAELAEAKETIKAMDDAIEAQGDGA